MKRRPVIPIQIERKAGELYRLVTIEKAGAVHNADILVYRAAEPFRLKNAVLAVPRIRAPKTEIALLVHQAVIKSPVFLLNLSAAGEG